MGSEFHFIHLVKSCYPFAAEWKLASNQTAQSSKASAQRERNTGFVFGASCVMSGNYTEAICGINSCPLMIEEVSPLSNQAGMPLFPHLCSRLSVYLQRTKKMTSKMPNANAPIIEREGGTAQEA